jgi:hypothetical protein
MRCASSPAIRSARPIVTRAVCSDASAMMYGPDRRYVVRSDDWLMP